MNENHAVNVRMARTLRSKQEKGNKVRIMENGKGEEQGTFVTFMALWQFAYSRVYDFTNEKFFSSNREVVIFFISKDFFGV